MSYWKDRMAASQTKLSAKSIKEIEKQIKKYYGSAMKKAIADFEALYNKVLAKQAEGEEITPAWLYKMDSYWKMQGQLRQELQKLGDRQISMLSRIFETNFFEVYYSINIKGAEAFSTIDTAAVKQLINQIWVADGKSWSQRVWNNTSKLLETLNEELVACVANGKKTTELKKKLQERFGVSYSQADSLARTEIAHIQTQAAKQRYQDYGLTKVQFWADPDERTCPECGKLHKKIYNVGEHVPCPVHPRCRCCIIPVIEDNKERKEDKDMQNKPYELTETEKEQLEKIYAANPELRKTIKDKQYFIKNTVIGNRESTINSAQRALDGEWKPENFLRQHGIVKWDEKNKQAILPRNPEKAVKDYQDKLRKEIEKYQKEIDKMDYDVLHSYIFCEDCGMPIHIDGKKTNAVKRCPDCQEIYRKWYKAQKEKERRAKKKN